MGQSAGNELQTVLVVDDSAIVLETVVAILGASGFRVLSADGAREAIRISAEFEGAVHLLLSDVQMPEMSGPDLGALLRATRPQMHVMLMSGLSGGDLLVLNYGWAFIEKPFVATKLVEMVKRVIDTPDRSQGSHGFDTENES